MFCFFIPIPLRDNGLPIRVQHRVLYRAAAGCALAGLLNNKVFVVILHECKNGAKQKQHVYP